MSWEILWVMVALWVSWGILWVSWRFLWVNWVFAEGTPWVT